MSLPGSGLLASLRGNFSGGERSGPSDDAKFEARSSAVLAVEHAVASGAVGHPGRKVPRGCFVETVDGEFTYRLDEAHSGEDHVELTFNPIVRIAAEYKEAHMRQIAVNEQFITYGLKQGLIRVLHRFSEARALLKGHSSLIADICFVQDNILVSGGQNGEVFAWRFQVQDGDNAIHAEQILHVKLVPGYDSAAVLLAKATTPNGQPRVMVASGNAVVALTLPLEGPSSPASDTIEVDPLDPSPLGIRMTNFPVQDTPTSLSVSSDGQYVAVGSKHGRVYVAQFSRDGGTLVPRATIDGSGGRAVTNVGWLEMYGTHASILIAANNGTQLTSYATSDGAQSFERRERVVLEPSPGKTPSFIHAQVVPECHLVVLADTPRKSVYTLHWSSDPSNKGSSFDYIAPFKVGLPVLNFSAMWNPDSEAGEDGALELNCVQTEGVKQYIVDPGLCLDTRGGPPIEKKPSPAPPGEEGRRTPPPLPSPHLANGRGNAQSTAAEVEPAPAELTRGEWPGPGLEECPSPPSTPTAPAVMVQVPLPVVIPTNDEEPVESGTSTTVAAPEGEGLPAAPLRLLTPKDLLPSPATVPAERGGPAPSTAPSSGTIKLLQRHVAGTAAAEEDEAMSVPREEPAADRLSVDNLEDPQARGQISALVAEEMSNVHRKFAGHVSAMYRELLKAVKAELSTQAAAHQAVTEALLREALAAQTDAVAAERAAVLAEERAGMERLLGAISATLNRDVPARLGEVMRAELDGLSSSLAVSLTPAVREAAAAALPREEMAAVIKSGIEKALPTALQTVAAKPLQDAFRQSFSKQIVPSFENATQSMFLQMDKALSKGLREHVEASRAELQQTTGLATSLRESLHLASNLTETLRASTAQQSSSLLRTASVSSQRSPSGASDLRTELGLLISQGRYDDAFSKALGLQDVTIVSWLCTKVDAATVLSTSRPGLSQMVLLSLVQQLAADMHRGGATNKLQWIREAALALDPQDPLLGPHLKPVLTQVHANLAAVAPKLQGGDVQSCKLAMHVIHSQMTS